MSLNSFLYNFSRVAKTCRYEYIEKLFIPVLLISQKILLLLKKDVILQLFLN